MIERAERWGIVVISIVVLVVYGAMLGCLLTFTIPPSALALANIMLGSLSTMATAVVQYWVGSSSSSRSKDSMLAEATQALAVSAPVAVVPIPPRPEEKPPGRV